MIGDTLDPSRVRKVVFCSGKVYYDLIAARDAKQIEDVAMVRVEDLYPFPYHPGGGRARPLQSGRER